MDLSQITARPSRPARPVAPEIEHRGVRLPTGADSRLFGGWGVRF
jgi:hypothetical protein